uniref:Si:ch73-208h1.4 n=1 Tax=Kryptolebias marmoratus TaxID=37003 RepID=A0A3Q3A4N2_KRYMA
VIVVVFCVVCFLLLLAFVYAFCFRCSIGPSRKESRAANACSLEPEDATYKCSSSDSHSAQNAV